MKKMAVIGCGLRSSSYMMQFKDGLGINWELSALADPNPAAIAIYRTSFARGKDIRTFTNGPDLLEAMGDSLDAVIIGTPNVYHIDSIVPAMEKKLSILLEKPVATTLEDCKTLWNAYLRNGRPNVVVGFVLPYTNYFKMIKEVVANGSIGRILSMEASQMLSPLITSAFTREWRRLERMAGPFVVEKCSHDMDIFNMLAGAPARHVSSFAARTNFVPKAEAAMYCKDCTLEPSCRYSPRNLPFGGMEAIINEEAPWEVSATNDLCVYNSDKDVPDHQIVHIEYENGVLATFSAAFDQPIPSGERTLKINGTEGRLVGSLDEDHIEVLLHRKGENGKHIKETYMVEHDDSPHSGGDSILTDRFKSIMMGEQVKPLAGMKEGIDACLIGFAAEQSRHTNTIVRMKALFEEVYGKPGEDEA